MQRHRGGKTDDCEMSRFLPALQTLKLYLMRKIYAEKSYLESHFIFVLFFSSLQLHACLIDVILCCAKLIRKTNIKTCSCFR